MTTNTGSSHAQIIDAEHQVQIQLLKALREAAATGGDVEELQFQLMDYCRVHFLSEELLMRLHAYPDYQDHMAAHEEMVTALEKSIGPDSLDALSAMLMRHIGSYDAKLHEYLEAI